MKIALVSIMDNGNFCRHFARGLRDYCGVDAKAYALQQDAYTNMPDPTVEYLEFPRMDQVELPDADLYITNDHTYFQLTEHFLKRPRIVKCNGTFARKYGPWFENDRRVNKTLYLSSPLDYSLAVELGFTIQTIPPIIDMRLFPEPDFAEDKIIIGHAPTNMTKNTKYILEQLQPYRKKKNIELDIITGVPWQECITRKAKCHIFIDQYNMEWQGIGVNALESLALGSVVLNAPIHPYITQHYPAIKYYIDVFPDSLKNLLNTPTLPFRAEWASQDYAKETFDLEAVTPLLYQWCEFLVS